MSDTEKAKAALAGNGGGEGNGDTGAAAEKPQAGQASELEKAKHTADVWAGRAKQLQEEKKALEEKLRKFESGQAVDAALKSLTPEEKSDTPDEYLGASGRMAAKLVGDAQAATKEEIERIRQEMAAEREKSFYANIAQRYGDFFDSVGPGGDKSEYWERFKANNRETFDAVMSNHDEARFGALVGTFYRELGLPAPGAGATASPTPSTTGGPSPAGFPRDAQTLTSEQYLKELERAEEMRRSGDMKGWRELNDRLKSALNEGRVK